MTRPAPVSAISRATLFESRKMRWRRRTSKTGSSSSLAERFSNATCGGTISALLRRCEVTRAVERRRHHPAVTLLGRDGTTSAAAGASPRPPCTAVTDQVRGVRQRRRRYYGGAEAAELASRSTPARWPWLPRYGAQSPPRATARRSSAWATRTSAWQDAAEQLLSSSSEDLALVSRRQSTACE